MGQMWTDVSHSLFNPTLCILCCYSTDNRRRKTAHTIYNMMQWSSVLSHSTQTSGPKNLKPTNENMLCCAWDMIIKYTGENKVLILLSIKQSSNWQ